MVGWRGKPRVEEVCMSLANYPAVKKMCQPTLTVLQTLLQQINPQVIIVIYVNSPSSFLTKTKLPNCLPNTQPPANSLPPLGPSLGFSLFLACVRWIGFGNGMTCFTTHHQSAGRATVASHRFMGSKYMDLKAQEQQNVGTGSKSLHQTGTPLMAQGHLTTHEFAPPIFSSRLPKRPQLFPAISHRQGKRCFSCPE